MRILFSTNISLLKMGFERSVDETQVALSNSGVPYRGKIVEVGVD